MVTPPRGRRPSFLVERGGLSDDTARVASCFGATAVRGRHGSAYHPVRGRVHLRAHTAGSRQRPASAKGQPHIPIPAMPKPSVLEWYYQCADGEAYGPVSAPEMAKLE